MQTGAAQNSAAALSLAIIPYRNVPKEHLRKLQNQEVKDTEWGKFRVRWEELQKNGLTAN